jgi:hypothetical protein
VLDISGNIQISALPVTIVQLRQLKCLYINEANSNAESPWQLYRTIKGIRVLASLEELSRLYADKDDIEELGHLTELKVLDIVVSCGDLKLVDCLHKLQNIQNLSIYLSAGGLKGWVGPQSLRSLQVDNPWFPKLLVWINHSHARNLSFLRISVKQLQQEDMETLGRLPALRDIHMWLGERRSIISREFVFRDGSFPSLEHASYWDIIMNVWCFNLELCRGYVATKP